MKHLNIRFIVAELNYYVYHSYFNMYVLLTD